MESGTMGERRKKTIKTRDRVVNAVFPGLDVVVDCGGNFRQTGSQDSSSSITTFGCLFDALLPVCFVSSFVGGEFEWEWGLFGCRGKENLDPQITQITQN